MNISYFILGLIIITTILIVHYNIVNKDMVYIKADIDDKYYLVRDVKDKHKAANFLSKLRHNIFLISDYMYNKLNSVNGQKDPRYIENSPYILQLKRNIQNIVIKESSAYSSYTSYSLNKGEEIVFCIRSKSISSYIQKNNMHEFNLVMYVLLHEISHIACPEYDHTPLFKSIFKFICEEAIELGIYKYINFIDKPREYCGMYINESIL
jgi:hypothetical protein